MHHLTPRAPPICRKDHPCIERSASHFQLFPLTMGVNTQEIARQDPWRLGGHVFGAVAAREQRQPVEHADHEQIGEAEEHEC